MNLFFLYLMAGLYVAAGVYHFVKPRMYAKIVPALLPNPLLLVYVTGVAEILLGLLLLIPQVRAFAAWGIIVLLIAVFPANIKMMMDYKRKRKPYYWLTLVRLPMQGLLIWWAWQYT